MPIVEIQHATLDARVRMFRAGEEVDCFVVVTDSHVIVIDTFSTPEEALEMMEVIEPNLKTRELLVINTHQHYDHAWGNSVFAADGEFPVPILAHQNSKHHLEQQRTTLLEKQASDSRFANVKIIAPTLYFSERCTINAGDLSLELFPAFGHTNDQVAIWIPEIQTLLAADALEFPFPYVASSGSLEQLLSTMHNLKSLKPKVIAPCHGGIHDARLIDQNLAYYAKLEARVRAKALPIEALDLPDLPERLGFSFEDALAMLGLETASDFYRDFHQRNCKTLLKHVNT